MNLRSHAAVLAAILVVAIWGETFVSSKVLLTHGLMPADIFFFRFTLAYCCMAALSHKRMWSRSLLHEAMLASLGLLGGSLYFLSENMALMYSTPSNVAILVGTTPLTTAMLLAIFHRDERMDKWQTAGSAIAFIGMAMVVLNGQLVLHLNPLGDMLALGASLTWGFYSLIIKRLSHIYPTAFITRKVFAYGLLTVTPYFLFVDTLHTDLSVLTQPAVWGNILYLGFIASMVCYLMWNWVMTQLGTVRATNIIYLQSFFTMIISHVILGEHITIMAITGAIVLILGMLIATRKSKAQNT